MRLTKRRVLAVAVLAGLAVVWWLRGDSYPITNAQVGAGPIIAFGDSLTAGYAVDNNGAYPQQLADLLGTPVINRGVSGDTTGQGLARLQRDVLGDDPGIVLLCLGANDFMRRLDEDRAFANLETIVERIQQRGALVILIGLDLPLNPSYARRYRELARRKGCPFVPDVLDGIVGHRDLMQDQVHPNARGYKLWADKVERVLRPYVNRSK